tara:strand:+ start:164 stop:421 length:258 start_codon:yes stop_codon:yes gene_type:complete
MPQKAQSIQTIIQGAQLVALILGIAAVMTTIGRRDAQITRNIEDISELRKISEDILKASIASQFADQYQNEQLQSLLSRIEKLEG